MSIFVRFVCLAGLVAAVLSVREHILLVELGNESATFCSAASAFNCGLVSESAYSEVAGIPLGAFGILFYGLLLVLSVFLERDEQIRSRNQSLFAGFAVVNVFVSLILFAVSHFLIGALCLLCTVLYGISVLLLLAVWLELRPGYLSALKGFPAALLAVAGEVLTLQAPRGRRLALSTLVLIAGTYALFPLIRSMERPQTRIPDALWDTRARLNMFTEYESGTERMREPTFGPTNAPLLLVEYFDYECPACRIAQSSVDYLKRSFPRELRVVYRVFPLDSTCNPNITGRAASSSCYLSRNAICADEQGAFLDVHQLIFELAEVYTDSRALRRAFDENLASLSIDHEALNHCLVSGRADAKIQLDIRSAMRLNVPGTPAMFLNGVRVDHSSPERLVAAVRRELEKQGS